MAKVKKIAPTARFSEIRPAVDLDTLQAVITHRYDVMARYVRSARQVAKEELARIQLNARERRLIKRFIAQGNSETGRESLTPAMRERFAQLFEQSERLKQIQAMRNDLEALWARSAASHEQLVRQLQDWVARAEASGIQQLEEFSLSLRRYAI